MPPCEGDFTPWIRALRLPTTFSMSESENECEWVTIFLDDSPARNMEYGVKHKTMCHKGAYFCLGVPCNGAHEISDSLWYFPCVYEISWMEWAGSGQHFKVNKKRKSLLCSFFVIFRSLGGGRPLTWWLLYTSLIMIMIMVVNDKYTSLV